MKNTRIDPVSDNVMQLMHSVRRQGSLADLSDEQLNAIARPDSIVGLIMLLNSVDSVSQETIIAEVDIDYLAEHCIMNDYHLGMCLTLSPLLTKSLLLNTRLFVRLIRDLEALITVINLVPQYAVIFLAVPQLRSLIKTPDNYADIILAAPETAKMLLPGFLTNADRLCDSKRVLEVLRAVSRSAEYYGRIISRFGFDDYLPDWVYAIPQITVSVYRELENTLHKITIKKWASLVESIFAKLDSDNCSM
nr:hypothetical protein [Pseudomonadota bacterium]